MEGEIKKIKIDIPLGINGNQKFLIKCKIRHEHAEENSDKHNKDGPFEDLVNGLSLTIYQIENENCDHKSNSRQIDEVYQIAQQSQVINI
jgi:hypothetical protein